MEIVVQNQIHDSIERYDDEPGDPFLGFAVAASKRGAVVLGFINQYADCMLNFLQLNKVQAEIETELMRDDIPESQRRAAMKFATAARKARELSGYIMVIGD
jgi:hypothetical protein